MVNAKLMPILQMPMRDGERKAEVADEWHYGDAMLPTTGDMMLLAGGCATLSKCDATLPTMY